MDLLLDTHVALWWLDDPDTITATTRERIRDPGTRVMVSAASAWEVAIKRALGQLEAPDDLLEVIGQAGFEWLTIRPDHAWAAGALARHHADPFDRMLVAQAQTDGLALVTRDRVLGRYGVPILEA